MRPRNNPRISLPVSLSNYQSTRRLMGLALLFLAFAALFLSSFPRPAQAQDTETEIWSATLVAGDASGNFGYFGFSGLSFGSLNPNTITLEGDSYTVQQLSSSTNVLSIHVVNQGTSSSTLTNGTYRLYVGNTAYDLIAPTDAVPAYTHLHNQGSPVMASGQTYTVRLVRVTETEIWSGSLYAGQSGSSNGYFPNGQLTVGGLDPSSFDLDGNTYNVRLLASDATDVRITLDAAGQDDNSLPGESYHLYVGDTPYNLIEGSDSGAYYGPHNQGSPIFRVGSDYTVRLVTGKFTPPRACAGPDLEAQPGDEVTLLGDCSVNPHGKRWGMAHLWTQPAGQDISLSDATIAKPTFTMPSDAAPGAVYTFTLTVTDQDGESDSDSMAVTVPGDTGDSQTADPPPNNAPVFGDGSETTRSIPENSPAGTKVGAAITATDPDGDTLAYSLSGTDAASFGIDSEAGHMTTIKGVTYDFETKVSYSLSVDAKDGNGGAASIAMTVTLTDVDETSPNGAPLFDDGSETTRSIPENSPAGTNVGAAIAATDRDGDTLTYSLSATDASSFAIDEDTGQLTAKSGVTYDFEAKASYSLTVNANDGNGGSASIDVTVTLTEVYEMQPNSAPVFDEGDSTTRSLTENSPAGTNVGAAITATDDDGDTLTYALSGTDAEAFEIGNSNGQITTKSGVEYDYETQASYDVTVTATDLDGASASIDVTVSLDDVDEAEPNRAPPFGEGGSTTHGITAEAQMSLAAPSNVQVVNGANSGDVVASWDEVAGASGYTILWVNYAAAWDAYHSGHDWMTLTLSVDVPGGEITSHTFTVSSPDTASARYLFAVGSKGSPEADPAWSRSHWVSLLVRGGAVSNAEILDAALAIANGASALHAQAYIPTDIGMTPEDIQAQGQRISTLQTTLNQQLEILDGSAHQDRVARVRQLVNDLIAGVNQIQAGRPALLEALYFDANAQNEVLEQGPRSLFRQLDAASDSQLTRVVDQAATPDGVSQEEILLYKHLDSMYNNVGFAKLYVFGFTTLTNPAFIELARGRFDRENNAVSQDIEYLERGSGIELEPSVQELVNTVKADQVATEGAIPHLERRLSLSVAERMRITANEAILTRLRDEISFVADGAMGRTVPPIEIPKPDTGVPGVGSEAIVFGQSAALTGPSQELGRGMQLGIQAAFNEVNQAGGVHGRALALETVDDGYEPIDAFRNYFGLIQSGEVFGLIGGVGTPTTRAGLPLIRNSGVPFIAPFTGAQLIREPDLTNVFNLRASYHEETEKIVEYLQKQGKTRVAVLYQNDSYGQDGLSGVKLALDTRNDMELVSAWHYIRNSWEAVNYPAYRIAAGRPDAVIMVGTHIPTAGVVKLLRERLGRDTIFASVSFVGSRALSTALEGDYENVFVSQVTPLPTDDSIPLVAEYRAALAAVDPQAEPSFVSLEGYMAGRLAIEGLKLCGRNVTRECFNSALLDAEVIDLSGWLLEFGPGDNQGTSAVTLSRINPDGRFVAVE